MQNRIQSPLPDLVEQLPVGIYSLLYRAADNSFSFTFVNDRFCEIMGLSKAAIMDDPTLPMRVVLPLDAGRFYAANQGSLLTGEPFAFEGRFRVCDKERWLSIRSQRSLSVDGEDVWNGILVDVTARKTIEAKLRQHSYLLEAAQKAACFGYYVTDMKTGQWTSSSMLDEIMGIDGDYDRTVSTWGLLVHPEDRQRSLDEFWQAMRKRVRLQHQYRIIRPDDGRIIWVDASGTLELENDQPIRLIGTVRDITENKEYQLELERYRNELEALVEKRTADLVEKSRDLLISEERFRLAMRAAQDGLWDWDARTNKVYCSPAYFSMLGYSAEDLEEDFQGIFVNLIHPDDRDWVVHHITQKFQTVGSHQTEFRLRAKNGQYRWILGRGEVIERDEEGVPVRMIGTHVDISDRKEAEFARIESEHAFATSVRLRATGSGSWIGRPAIPSSRVGYLMCWVMSPMNLSGAPLLISCNRRKRPGSGRPSDSSSSRACPFGIWKTRC